MSATALTLTWTASTGTSPVLYQPQFKVTGGSTWLSFGSPISTLTVVVTGLSASTSYDFQIVASNAYGTATSSTATGATSSGNPFPAPGNVSGSQNTGTAAPVIAGPQNGAVATSSNLAITGITITDAAATSGTLLVQCTSGTLTMTLSGSPVSGSGSNTITLSTTFANCQAAVGTLIYTGPSSPTIDTVSIKFTDQALATNTLLVQIQISTVSTAVAPNAPTSVAASAATNTTMRLDWIGSTVGTAPITYQPLFKLASAPTFAPSGQPVSGLTATVTGLSAGVSYNFAVTAANAAGSATSASIAASTTNAATAPSAPTGLQVTANTSTSLTYTWSPPAIGSTPITYQPMFRATSASTGTGTRVWHEVIGGDRSLTTTPFQTTATWRATSDTMVTQLRALTFASVRSKETTGFVSPFWISNSINDILCTFHDSTNTIADFQMRVPAGANTEDGFTSSADNSAGFIDTSIPYRYVTFNDCRIGSNASNATSAGVVSATNNFIMCGPGFGSPGGMIVQDATGPTLIDAVNGSITPTTWENGDNVSGCITYHDLLQCIADPNYVIQHLIGVNLDLNVLSPSGVIWPLVIGDPPASNTSGAIREGCIIGIPASTARPVGRTRAFYVLFDLFQHFGGMFNNVTSPTQIGIKTMPRDSATATLVADMNNQFINVVPFLNILNFTSGMAGAQYSVATLKGRLANATQWSDAFPAPPTLDFSPSGGVPVLPATFGAWRSANGLGQVYSVIWPGNSPGVAPFAAFGSAISGTSVTITGLQANTSYDLEVIASNSVGTATSATIVALTGLSGIPTDTTGTQARPAQDMLNRIGINTHFGNGLYASYDIAQAITVIQSIGCTLVRDSENG